MTNKELLEEIRLNRTEMKAIHDEMVNLKVELTLFKGKAFSFITIISFIFSTVINAGISLYKTKG
jgi:hypothetical protein